MDPIETWHDAPTFEAMEKRIEYLENTIANILGEILKDKPSCYYCIGTAKIASAALERK